jgi:hypothetical protein
MRHWFSLFFWLIPSWLWGAVADTDLQNFRQAYQQLAHANSREDSLLILETQYFRKGTAAFKAFARKKKITPLSLCESLARYPSFYASLHALPPPTEEMTAMQAAIDPVFSQYFKSFKTPAVYLVMGDLSVGGTVYGNTVFICWEMVASNTALNKSELPPYLKTITEKADMASYLAHETVHTLQKGFPLGDLFPMIRHGKNSLLHACILEGSADFIAHTLLGLNLNAHLQAYGLANECLLWQRFQQDFQTNPFAYNEWLYTYAPRDGRPADLGYFLGFKVCEAYVEQTTDQAKALAMLLRKGKYKKVYARSGYRGGKLCG